MPILKTNSLRLIQRLAPSAAIGVFLYGVINSGTLALLPIFAMGFAPTGQATQYSVAAFMAATIGGLISQWPLGRLSDYIDRRTVIACTGVLSAFAAFVLAIFSAEASLLFLLGWLAIWGAGSLSLYGISVAHGIDRVKPHQITELMSGLLFVWAGGAVIGPIASGLAMRMGMGPSRLFG